MDGGFIDLDLFLTKIRNPKSRIYFVDAVRSYKAGALRGAITSAWVAVVYDLIAKYRELSAMDDRAAAAFIGSWDKATRANNISEQLKLEARILDDATGNTQVINPIARKHLERLREDRHLCAHPAFSAEADLFQPSPELVRLHLFNAVDLVLSQEPLQGKAILEVYNADVQSAGFPTEHDRIIDYVEQRYLTRVRDQNICNFGMVLAKSLLNGVPENWEPLQRKIIASLVAVRDRAEAAWPDIRQRIVGLIDNLDPSSRPRAIAFIATFPDSWSQLQEATRTALQMTIRNTDPANFNDYRMLAGLRFPQFRKELLRLVEDLDADKLTAAIAAQPHADLWPKAVLIYQGSITYRMSENNFRNLIMPFARHLSSQKFDRLLDAIIDNPQNLDAYDTGELLLQVLHEAQSMDRPTYNARDRFCQAVGSERYSDRYEAVLSAFEEDGWMRPPQELPADVDISDVRPPI